MSVKLLGRNPQDSSRFELASREVPEHSNLHRGGRNGILPTLLLASLLQATLLEATPSIRLEPLGSVQLPAGGRDVAFEGDRAYVIGDFGLSFVDLANPASPLLLSSTENTDLGTIRGTSIAVRDGVGYTTFPGDFRSLGSLSVVDLRDPSSVGLLFQTPLVEGDFTKLDGVVLAGNQAVIASTAGGVRWFDITDPRSPVLQFEDLGLGGGSPFDVGGSGDAFAVLGNYVYSAYTELPFHSSVPTVHVVKGVSLNSRGNGFRVPRATYTLGSARLTGTDVAHPLAMAAMGNHLLVATVEAGLKVLSVDRGTNFTEVASVPLVPTNRAMQIVTRGSTAFVLHSSNRIASINLAVPARPVFSEIHTSNVDLRRIQLLGTNLVALDASDSLQVYGLREVEVGPRKQTIRLVTELPSRIHACWSIPGTNSPARFFVDEPTLSLDATSDSGLPVQWTIAETTSFPTNVVRAEIRSVGNSVNLRVWPDRWTGSGMPSFEGMEIVYGGHREGERLSVRLVASVLATPEFEAATMERVVEFDFSPRLEIQGLDRIPGTVGPVDVARIRIPDIEVRARQQLPSDPFSPPPGKDFVRAAYRYQVQYSTNLTDWISLPTIYPTGSGVVSVPLPVDAASASLRLRRVD